MLNLFCRTHDSRRPRAKELIATVAAHAVAERTIGVRGFFEWDAGEDPVPAPNG